MRILNYLIRISIVVIGLLFIFELIKLDNLDSNATKMMGVVFVLFGIYRLSMLYFQEKRELYSKNDEE